MKQNNYNCDVCGKGIYLKPSRLKASKHHYCSIECKNKGNSLFYTGENHPNYSQQPTNCDWCKKEISKPINVFKRNKNNFCSKKCKDKYFATITSQSKESKERTRRTTLKNLNNGIIKTDTSIQQVVNTILKQNNIKFENEYIFNDKYSVDNYLLDYNLIIEVQGDFWHINPLKYNVIKYDMQLRSIKSDKAKHTFIKKYKYVEILYLWECDIRNNIELCEKLILEYVNNKGVLQNYESFNYTLVNNIPVLNTAIIKPYREYSKEYIHTITDLSIRQKPEYYLTFNCEVCGSEKVQKKCVYEKHKHHYCSRVCAVRGRTMFNESTVIKFNCDNCGVQCEQPRAQYNANKTHFCSPACRGIYVKTTTLVNCDNCNNEIEITAKQKRLYNHHFCNNSCRIQFNQKQR